MSTTLEIRAPAEQTEGTRSQLLRWLKRVGESVAANEPLIELETDKVTVEVAAPASGVLTEILKQEQEEIAPGELLGRIDAGATGAAVPAAPGAHGAADAAEAGSGRAGAAVPPAPAAAAAAGAGAASLSPAVRRLLAEHRLNVEAVPGTGPGGRISVEDVLRAAAGGAGAAAGSGAAAPATPPEAGTRGMRSHRVAHTAVRKRIAEHMVQSVHTAPHVTTVFEADLTAVLQDR